MTFLVIGATGTVGPSVVGHLLGADVPVRILVRDGERAHALFGTAVQTVAGDAADPSVLARALDGIEAVFLLSPHTTTFAALQLGVLRAARHRSIRIVKLSGTASTIRPDGSDVGRQHWEVETVLVASGAPFVILRSNTYFQSFMGPGVLGPVRATGTLPNALGDALVSAVDARDVGAVAARVLLSSRWDGNVLELTGPRAVTVPELGEVLSAKLGSRVEVTDLTLDDLRASLLSRGMGAHEVDHVVEVQAMLRAGGSSSVSSTIHEVTGRPATDIDDYVRGVL